MKPVFDEPEVITQRSPASITPMGDQQKWPDNLFIIRHGRSKRNHDRETAQAAGKSADFSEGLRDQDTPLTPTGEMQSLALGVHLRESFPLNGGVPSSLGWTPKFASGVAATSLRPIDVLYVSPYLRTRQTMEKIVEGLGYRPHIIYDERLREIEFGAMDGLDRSGYQAKYPEELRLKDRTGKYFYRPPGGENRPDVKLRVRSFLDTLVRDARGLNVGIVCHSVIVLVFRSLLEKWGEDDYLQVDKENDVKNASLTHYAYEPVEGRNKLVLKEYNSIFYTEEG